MKLSQKETTFTNEVVTRFELYNSLFLTLPFYQIKHTGSLLPFFTSHCEEGVKNQLAPSDIIESFFGQYEQYVQTADRFDLLFRFIQYIERQVVLFDAVEDASFNKTGRGEDTGSLQSLFQQAAGNPIISKKIKKKFKDLSLRLVLTAHPTQFYPGPVLAIITDLIEELKQNDINAIHLLLKQLGKTPFFNKNKPSPVDEAVSLAWFLENVFYHATASIQSQINNEFEFPVSNSKPLIELGFWPGGDRDGNPNVTVESTKTVSELLRKVLFRCYYRDFRMLKRRLTFRGLEDHMAALQDLFYENSFNVVSDPRDQQSEIINNLEIIIQVLNEFHDGLFVDKVEDLLGKVKLFGCYFASLDIRQDSRILRNVHQCCLHEKGIEIINDLSELEKIQQLRFDEADIHCSDTEDFLIKDALDTIRLIRQIQNAGGEKSCHRFIISNCQQASDILQLMELFLWSGWKKDHLFIDFVPLFETIDDLSQADKIMERLYTHPFYKEHLKRRKNKQTIMLGFSDSSKDGGYLMANWSILKAKVSLTAVARKNGIDLAFFDGRGGPPARGGGKTHRFYASMGKDVANDHIQLTIQGQTISSQYGSVDSAHYNMEQLINAGIISSLDQNNKDTLTTDQTKLIDNLARSSYATFLALREHPLFLKYLEEFSPLKLLSQINISSRPVKRNADSELRLEDLRAISFVTAWSQLKQNIPGYYGVGTALKKAKDEGSFEDIKKFYNDSGQFKTMIDNCMMSMSKSDFRITAYLQEDQKFGKFWKMIKEEFELTRRLLLEVSDTTVLMEQYPVERKSIALREKIVMPLVIIQHYALQQLKNLNEEDRENGLSDIYDKLIIRTVYGIVNAGRNLV
ncbi:phosphoenolpyruvate carboxylase [Daejeonella oryzae]|uniref:phosphoenolpyruvate carboxylase n=1 Tax=Daejeonella oryzae TaxID=1122943 RepID=UPI00041AD58F|nr:phosphoenolpyruvate carboxylase [Daejeonella oryzae]